MENSNHILKRIRVASTELSWVIRLPLNEQKLPLLIHMRPAVFALSQ